MSATDEGALAQSGRAPACQAVGQGIEAPTPRHDVVQAILDEVARATKEFPTWPTDPLHAVAVLGEEFGELTKAALQLTYEPHKTSAEEVRTEAIQTAAMALRFAMSLDVYRYERGEQHEQGALAADLNRRLSEAVSERDALKRRLTAMFPLFQEARDAITAIPLASAKLHHIDLTLADRMDDVGVSSRWAAREAETTK